MIPKPKVVFSPEYVAEFKNPERVIEAAQEAMPHINNFSAWCSGGKDSVVTAHIMKSLGITDTLTFCNTGVGVKENFEFFLKFANDFGFKYNVIYPKENEHFEDFVRKFGFPKAAAHNMVMGYLKWHPLRKFSKDNRKEGRYIAFASGRRVFESKRRKKKLSGKPPFEETDFIIFVNPIYFWTDEEVWAYVKEHNLPICPVYETMHLSGDCMCGAFSLKSESRLLNIFHKDTAEYIKSLEQKYGGSWGNGVSITGAAKETTLSSNVCNECAFRINTTSSEGIV